jgi:hypothetical protein
VDRFLLDRYFSEEIRLNAEGQSARQSGVACV